MLKKRQPVCKAIAKLLIIDIIISTGTPSANNQNSGTMALKTMRDVFCTKLYQYKRVFRETKPMEKSKPKEVKP